MDEMGAPAPKARGVTVNEGCECVLFEHIYGESMWEGSLTYQDLSQQAG